MRIIKSEWGSNLQPGTSFVFVHALHLGFIVKLVHQTIHQIHQGLDQVGVRGRGQLLIEQERQKTLS